MEHITGSGPDLRVTGSHWKKGKAIGQMGGPRCLMREWGFVSIFEADLPGIRFRSGKDSKTTK